MLPIFLFFVVPFLPFTIFTLYDASVDEDQMRGKGGSRVFWRRTQEGGVREELRREGLITWNRTWTRFSCKADEKEGRRIFCGRTEKGGRGREGGREGGRRVEGGLGRVPLANAMSLPATRPTDTGARQS